MNRIKIVSMLLCVGIPTASALLGGCATTPQATVQVAPPPPPPPQPMPQPVQTGPAVVTGVVCQSIQGNANTLAGVCQLRRPGAIDPI